MKRLQNLIFPEKCVLCRAVLETNEMDLCHSCRLHGPVSSVSGKKISFVDSWVSVWYYKGDARKSLLRYKFGGKRNYAESYGRLLAMKLQEEYPQGFDCLTYVPTGWFKKLKRGYDQVELLAEEVGKQLGMTPQKLLKKVRHNRTQSKIRGEARRRANVLGVYQIVDAQKVREKRILLLDDIITTGATVGECARILLTAGGKEVHCGCVAAWNQGKPSR